MNMLLKRGRLFLLLLMVLTLALTACGDSDDDETKTQASFTVGVINVSAGLEPAYTGFSEALAEAGYVEGETITYIYAGATPPGEALNQAIQDILAQDVDLILAISTPATRAIHDATAENPVPVIFLPPSIDTVTSIIENVAQPGGNMTGIMLPSTVDKRLELLLELDPTIQRIYVPHNAADPAVLGDLNTLMDLQSVLGIEIVADPVETADDVSAAIEALPDDIDAIFVLRDTLVFNSHLAWNEAAIERKIPITYSNAGGVHNGGLMSYGPDFGEMGKQAARLAVQVFKGSAEIGALPVEPAEEFLIINLNTAALIELDVSDTLVRQAHEVVREGDTAE